MSKRNVAISKLDSTKKTRERGNQQVDAVSNRLGEIGVGPQLLAEAYEHKSLDNAVDVACHRGPSLASESSVVAD
jgi:hypothetical protein